jgi:hypothetical protein
MHRLMLALFVLPSVALAAPVRIPVHGRLTTTDGEPVDGRVQVTFRLYGIQGASAAFTEVQQVDFSDGAFSAYVGANLGLDSTLFSQDQEMWVGIQIADDAEMAPILLGAAPWAAWSWQAAEAESLQGFEAADFLPTSYRPNWTDIQGRPSGLDDGDDVGDGGGGGGVDIVAGDGLTRSGDTISLDNATVEDLARGVCFDTRAELRTELDDRYLSVEWVPSWDNLADIPAGFADEVDNDTTYSAGSGITITNTTIALDTSAVDARVRLSAYDTEAELIAVLNDNYLGASYQPSWSNLANIPASFADGQDTDTTYSAGSGLSLTSTTFNVDNNNIETRARAVCYDSEAELITLLNDNYRASTWFPDAPGLRAILDPVYAPAGYVPTESALTALLNDNYAASNYVPAESALTNLLNDNYAPAGWVPSAEALTAVLDAYYDAAPTWASLTGIPADFSDNIDDDTLGGVSCVDGETPVASAGSWICEDLHVDALAPEDLADLLADQPLDLGAGTTIDGSPIVTTSAAVTAVAAAYPQVISYPRSPMLMFGFETTGCDLRGGSVYGNMVRLPTRHANASPNIALTPDLTLTNSGAGLWRAAFVNSDRFGYTCDGYAEGMAWALMESGTFTIDGKKVASGYAASVSTNDTIFFPTTFPTPPIVILTPGPGNTGYARVVGASAVSTGGFQVGTGVAAKPMYWMAFEAGSYNYGPWHFEAGLLTDPDNNETKTFTSTFAVPPNVLMTAIDGNNSGATSYVRVHDVTKTTFKVGTDANTATDSMGYVAFEELR